MMAQKDVSPEHQSLERENERQGQITLRNMAEVIREVLDGG
ncbi:MAG: hypothetical protein SV487_13485 [Thermodesulfobacteriota bacterium]|nr:hypothetical protein [Thermodesulfobacteriota bacterium]